MYVYAVIRTYPTLDLVDDDLDIHYADVGEIVAICDTKDKAFDICRKAQKADDDASKDLECDPTEILVSKWEVL